MAVENEVAEVSQEDDTSNADFNSGFDDLPTETPAAEQPNEFEQEAEQEAEVLPEYKQITVDEFNRLMTAAEQLENLRSTATSSIDKAFGKIGGLERRLSELAEGSSGVEVSAEDFAELMADYPEVADLQLKGLNRVLSKIKGGGISQEAINELVNAQLSAKLDEFKDTYTRDFELKQLSKAHKDWQAVDADPKFAEFIGTLPAEEQEAYRVANDEYDSEIIADVITKFKALKATPEKAAATGKKTNLRIEAAVAPKGDGRNPTGTNKEEDDFHAGFNEG